MHRRASTRAKRVNCRRGQGKKRGGKERKREDFFVYKKRVGTWKGLPSFFGVVESGEKLSSSSDICSDHSFPLLLATFSEPPLFCTPAIEASPPLVRMAEVRIPLSNFLLPWPVPTTSHRYSTSRLTLTSSSATSILSLRVSQDSLPSVAATGASGRASPSPFGLDAVIPASPASSSGGGSGMHRTPSGNFMPRNNSGLFSREPSFDCNICLDMPTDPVVTMCGHLFWYAPRPVVPRSHMKQFVTIRSIPYIFSHGTTRSEFRFPFPLMASAGLVSSRCVICNGALRPKKMTFLFSFSTHSISCLSHPVTPLSPRPSGWSAKPRVPCASRRPTAKALFRFMAAARLPRLTA